MRSGYSSSSCRGSVKPLQATSFRPAAASVHRPRASLMEIPTPAGWSPCYRSLILCLTSKFTRKLTIPPRDDWLLYVICERTSRFYVHVSMSTNIVIKSLFPHRCSEATQNDRATHCFLSPFRHGNRVRSGSRRPACPHHS